MQKEAKNSYERRVSTGKRPFQFWMDKPTEMRFKELIQDYDPELSLASAVLKCIKRHIEDYYLPGYAKKERKKVIIVNKEAEDFIIPKKS